MAADAQQAADALKPTAAKAETAETSEAKLNALAAVSETTAASEPVEEISQASAGKETQAAIADSGRLQLKVRSPEPTQPLQRQIPKRHHNLQVNL
jgi:hypothetical protein